MIYSGTHIAVPCSCEGNWCRKWPLPEIFPRGDKWQRNRVTSFLTGPNESGIGGTAVTEQFAGGRCVKVTGGHAITNEDALTSFPVTDPGKYTLTIAAIEESGVADCNHPTCAGYSVTHKETEKKLHFTVVPAEQCGPHPGRCPDGTRCKGDCSESPFTFFYCSPEVTVPCNKIFILDTPQNCLKCRCENECKKKGLTCCSNECVDLSSDNENCGICGNACGDWLTLTSYKVDGKAEGGEVRTSTCVNGNCEYKLTATCHLPDRPYPCATSCRQGGPCCMSTDKARLCRDPK